MQTYVNLSPAQLRRAADLQERIQTLQIDLASLLGGDEQGNGRSTITTAPKRRTISAAGIARIRAAQKARWAKIKRLSKK
jgi:hypothetical protein